MDVRRLHFEVTSLHLASSNGLKEVVELLIANGDTPLDLAVKNNRDKIVDFLRKHGAKTSEELDANIEAILNKPTNRKIMEKIQLEFLRFSQRLWRMPF